MPSASFAIATPIKCCGQTRSDGGKGFYSSTSANTSSKTIRIISALLLPVLADKIDSLRCTDSLKSIVNRFVPSLASTCSLSIRFDDALSFTSDLGSIGATGVGSTSGVVNSSGSGSISGVGAAPVCGLSAPNTNSLKLESHRGIYVF